MKILQLTAVLGAVLLLPVLMFNACKPLRNFTTPPAAWQAGNILPTELPVCNAAKKNVFIIADAKMTVLFDMLAPFYLFSATAKANVYIISKDKTPVLIKNRLFVMPQLTFKQADSMQLQADVIVVPALSNRDEHQDTTVVNWIKMHFASHTRLLAICDGATTAAATGLFDGKPLTCHASDYAGLKKHFTKPAWVQNTSVTNSGNLYSTAGVSNAVEGSLTVIDALFGRETMQKVLTGISYPAAEIKTVHKSIAVSGGNKCTVVQKIFFRKNKNIGLLIEDGINEFDMASIIETYARSFPASFSAFNLTSSMVSTKYGLTLLITVDTNNLELDELHVLTPASLQKEAVSYFKDTEIIWYENSQKQYMMDACLKRIAAQYGRRFENVVKISLDYN